jgi:hypothetical protein
LMVMTLTVGNLHIDEELHLSSSQIRLDNPR